MTKPVPCAEIIGYHNDPRTIEKALRHLCPKYNGCITLRRPEESVHISQYSDEVCSWHRDGDTDDQLPYAIVVWSNLESTEVKDDRTRKVLTFPPGAIVLIRNRRAKHRIPPVISPGRWFARVYDVGISAIRRKKGK